MSSKSDDAIRIGVIGLGRFARLVLPDLVRHPGFDVVAVSDPAMPERADLGALAREIGAAAYSTHVELLDDPAVQAVYVASPPATHLEIVVDALTAGCNVLCEKPLGIDAGETDRIRQAAGASGCVVAVDFPLEHDGVGPKWRALRRDGFDGRVRRGHVTIRCPRWPRPYQDVAWVAGRRQGGPVLEIGTHLVQLLVGAYGPLEVTRSELDLPSGSAPDGDDLAEIGVRAELRTETGAPIDVLVDCQVAGEEDVHVVVDGEQGTIAMPRWGELWAGRAGAPLERQALSARPILDAFHAAVHGRSARYVTADDAHVVQQIVDALRLPSHR